MHRKTARAAHVPRGHGAAAAAVPAARAHLGLVLLAAERDAAVAAVAASDLSGPEEPV